MPTLFFLGGILLWRTASMAWSPFVTASCSKFLRSMLWTRLLAATVHEMGSAAKEYYRHLSPPCRWGKATLHAKHRRVFGLSLSLSDVVGQIIPVASQCPRKHMEPVILGFVSWVLDV